VPGQADGEQVRSAALPLWAALAAAMLAAALCAGCSTLGENIARSSRRARKDLLVTVALPAQVVCAAAQDAYRFAAERPLTNSLASPVVFAFCAYKHAVVSLLYAGDLALFPFYMWFGPGEIGLYETSTFPFRQPEGLLVATERMARDAAVAVNMPFAVPLAAAGDVVSYVHSHPWAEAGLVPLVFALGIVRHAEYGAVHAADMLLYPLYFPFRAQPLRIYDWDHYPWRVARRYNATANRFSQSFRTFVTFPVMMWYHAYRSWKEQAERGPSGMALTGPLYVPAVALYHAYLGVVMGVDSALYPVLFWTGWGPVDLYNPGDMRLNPLKARAVNHLTAGVVLTPVGILETTVGAIMMNAASEGRKGADWALWGYLLFLHGWQTAAQGISNARQAGALCRLARTVATGYRCRTAPELLALACAPEGVELATADGSYELGDREELRHRAYRLANERLGDPVSRAERVRSPGRRRIARALAERRVRGVADVVTRTAEALARSDEALDARLARRLRRAILARTGAVTFRAEALGRIGHAPGAADRILVLGELLRVYHAPDDIGLQDRASRELDAVLARTQGDRSWYRRCRRELARIRNGDYSRRGTRNVLESLMIEGFVWLYEALPR